MPEATIAVSTSLFHQAASASAIRRRLSPQTRSHRSTITGRNPLASWSWISGTSDSSLWWTWSSGRGSAKPKASRTTISSSRGIPVSALSWAKVVPLSPAKRS
jgi:hypothetical protein